MNNNKLLSQVFRGMIANKQKNGIKMNKREWEAGFIVAAYELDKELMAELLKEKSMIIPDKKFILAMLTGFKRKDMIDMINN